MRSLPIDESLKKGVKLLRTARLIRFSRPSKAVGEIYSDRIMRFMQTSTRVLALDGLRAASIVCVLSAHMLPLGPKRLNLNYSAAGMGMSLFFALSGFLIVTNLLGGQAAKEFFVRRLSRIVPLAYLYILFVFLLIAYNPTQLSGNLLFLGNYLTAFLTNWNAHFWSLCVEIHFYLMIGLVVALFGRRGTWIVLPFCLAVTMGRVYDGAIIDIRTHLRVDEILAGGFIAILAHNGVLRFKMSPWWFLGAFVFWFAASSSFSGAVQYLRPYSSATVLATTICLRPGRLLSFLENQLLRYIASISYALYVIHPATIQGWMNEGSVAERYILKRPISFVLTFVFAHLSTFYWESRWIAWGKNIVERGRSAVQRAAH